MDFVSNFSKVSSVLLFEKVPEVFLGEVRRHVSHPQGRTRASEGKTECTKWEDLPLTEALSCY